MNNSHGLRLFTHCWHLAAPREIEARSRASTLGISCCVILLVRSKDTSIFFPANLSDAPFFLTRCEEKEKKKTSKRYRLH